MASFCHIKGRAHTGVTALIRLYSKQACNSSMGKMCVSYNAHSQKVMVAGERMCCVVSL